MRKFKDFYKYISKNEGVFIIAEAGVNHNGKLDLALKMIKKAKEAGADAVKFQMFKADNLVLRQAPKAEYQLQNTSRKESQYEMLKSLELSEADFIELKKECEKQGIMFLCTPFDEESARFLIKIGIKIIKISSGEVTNLPFLAYLAKFKLPIILSTGMSTLAEVKDAVSTIINAGNRKIVLLHCTSNYPVKFEDVNLRVIETLKREFDFPIGYSDHTEGIEVAIAAAAMGACVIEKHFTSDKSLPGPDHKASLESGELKTMIHSIRNIEKAKGDGRKQPCKAEMEVRKVARKSLVVACEIKKGANITRPMITIKRPGTGISPKYLERIIGKTTKKRIVRDQVLSWSEVQ